MIKILKTNIQKFSHIIHLADCHIRLNKRIEEYQEVFDRLYEEVKKSAENTCICLCGDIVHSKIDLSPECVKMVSGLFTNLSNLRPTIVIAGQHDANLSNKNRLDSLSPIVNALKLPNLYYLKETGLYGLGNILFNNMSIFDEPEKYIRGKDIPAIYRNQYEHIIALFHGPVDKAVLDTGYVISNPIIMPELFANHHLTLCGDIHKCQDITLDNDEVKIRMAGSLLQQNHGESLTGHGYSLWDLKTRTYQHIEIPNDYGYFTIEINKGKLVTDLTDLPKKVHLRVKCYESISSEVKAVIAKIKEKSQIVETAYIRMDQEKDKKDIIPLCKDIVLTDLTNIDYQNRLISDFITKKLNISNASKIDSILGINRKTNALIKKDDFSRNLKWKPIRFEFSNMFAYGEDNIIDFTNMSGIYGIFGPNKTGKSSILSAIIFCLFDKFDRGFKGSWVLNSQKTSFRCKLEFEISGVRYFIERVGTTTRTGNVKVDVRFWKIVNGKEEELHGTERSDTNDIIQSYIGTYDDFILTAASFQNAKNLTSFIDMGNTERKDLLVRFIGLDIFDRLHDAAGERNKELKAILKIHKDKNYSLEIQESEDLLAQFTTKFDSINLEIESLSKQISGVNEQIVSETSNLIKLDTDVPTDIDFLESRKITADKTLKAKQDSISQMREKLAVREKEVSEIEKEIKKIEESNLVESHKTYKELTDQINDLRQQMDLKKVEIKGKLDKVSRLAKYEYDPNCRFCTNNAFVKDATKAKSELSNDKDVCDRLMEMFDNYKKDLSKVEWVEEAYEKYTKLLTDRSKIKDECSNLSKSIIISINELEKLDTFYKSIIHQIELYQRNKTSVEINLKVQSKISSYKNALSKLDKELKDKNGNRTDVYSKMVLYKNNIEDRKKTIREVSDLEYERDSYEIYMNAVGRDGIPYQVICNMVPEIEKEINVITSQVFDYFIKLESDGKNIMPYLSYPDKGKYPLELSSGFEKSISSLAIQIALTNVSNLPKCNFLLCDENFSTLDPDNLALIPSLFQALKNNFDFIIVISHLSELKDATDNVIEIKQENGMSKVRFE